MTENVGKSSESLLGWMLAPPPPRWSEREREGGREARDSLLHSVSARPAPCWTTRRTEFQAADRCPPSAEKSPHARWPAANSRSWCQFFSVSFQTFLRPGAPTTPVTSTRLFISGRCCRDTGGDSTFDGVSVSNRPPLRSGRVFSRVGHAAPPAEEETDLRAGHDSEPGQKLFKDLEE